MVKMASPEEDILDQPILPVPRPGTPEPDEPEEPERRRDRMLAKTPSELKLPAYSGKVDLESQIAEALLAVRGKFFDQGLWAHDFQGLPDMQLDSIGDYILMQVCSQDETRWPTNYDEIISELETLPISLQTKKGLVKIGYALNYMKRVKLGLREVVAPYKAVPTAAMGPLVRNALDDFGLKPEEGGVVQIAEIVANASRRYRLCVFVIDGSPFMLSPYGGGKSQLLTQILYWSYQELDKTFDARQEIVYRKDTARMVRMFRAYDRHLPWGIDELDQFFDRREWAKPENKALVQAMQMYRKAGSPVIGACGSIWNLDERMRHKILTYRLEITRWDDDNFAGEAALFQKWGPPAYQKEEEDQWGKWLMNIAFKGLTKEQFDLYMGCNLKTLENEDRGGLDSYLERHPQWGVNGGELLAEDDKETADKTDA